MGKPLSQTRIDALLQVADWYEVVVAPGIDLSKPGIYQWTIEGENGGTYIGKFTNLRRPLREYQLNVAKLVVGRPYRRAKPDAFRRIHRSLFKAVQEGRSVQLTILENCEPSDLPKREAELIKERGTLNGSSASVEFIDENLGLTG